MKDNDVIVWIVWGKLDKVGVIFVDWDLSLRISMHRGQAVHGNM
jgi:hypothetical protein